MKIKEKILLSFLIPFILISTLSTFGYYYFGGQILKEKIYENLYNISENKKDFIDTFLLNQKIILKTLSEREEISEFLKKEERDVLYEESFAKLLSQFKESSTDYFEIFLLNKKGTIVVSSEEENVGLDRSLDEYFINAQQELFIKDPYLSKITGEKVFAFANPIINQENNDFLGIVVIRIQIDKSPIITSLEFGETGEGFLVNEDGYMITPSRFEDDTFLKKKVDTENTRKCFSHGEDVDITHDEINWSHDYRGEVILGTHQHIEEINWCLLIEMDQEEALSPLANIARIGFLIELLAILIILVIIERISDFTVRPISKLHKGVNIIAGGNFDYKVGTKSKDEIGKLSRVFDKMTSSLKESYHNIEMKVEKQVRQIKKNEKQMKRQQKALLSVMEDLQEKNRKISIERDEKEIILNNIGDGVFVIDSQFKIILINKMAQQLCGHKNISKIIGKRYNEILRFVDEETGKEKDDFIKKTIQTGKIQKMANHTILIRKDGTKIPVADSSAPLKNKKGRVIGCVVVFRDVTQERAIDKAKTEFVSLASHQLRTPLSIIKWYAEILLEEDAGELKTKQREYLKEIYNGNQRMISLVNALLSVSRLELGTLSIYPEPLSITTIVNKLINEFEFKINEKKIKFVKKYDKLPKIDLDKALIRIIFQNLISNAVKYTSDGGKVALKILRKNNKIEISIKDNGIGIPKKQQDQIFIKLFRADNAKEKNINGTGLGLYIVKSILDNCGGKIWFKSKENKGSTFYVSLPLKGMAERKGTKQLN